MRFADGQVWAEGCYVYENGGQTHLPGLRQRVF